MTELKVTALMAKVAKFERLYQEYMALTNDAEVQALAAKEASCESDYAFWRSQYHINRNKMEFFHSKYAVAQEELQEAQVELHFEQMLERTACAH